jgi:ABC-type Fe3+/spermidine/putrescine transport system ATPase subunit
MALIEVRHIRKTFSSKVALDDVSFSVEQGKTLVILGSSGGG